MLESRGWYGSCVQRPAGHRYLWKQKLIDQADKNKNTETQEEKSTAIKGLKNKKNKLNRKGGKSNKGEKKKMEMKYRRRNVNRTK